MWTVYHSLVISELRCGQCIIHWLLASWGVDSVSFTCSLQKNCILFIKSLCSWGCLSLLPHYIRLLLFEFRSTLLTAQCKAAVLWKLLHLSKAPFKIYHLSNKLFFLHLLSLIQFTLSFLPALRSILIFFSNLYISVRIKLLIYKNLICFLEFWAVLYSVRNQKSQQGYFSLTIIQYPLSIIASLSHTLAVPLFRSVFFFFLQKLTGDSCCLLCGTNWTSRLLRGISFLRNGCGLRNTWP